MAFFPVRVFPSFRSRHRLRAHRRSTSRRYFSAQLRSPYQLVHFRRSRFVAHLNELAHRKLLPSHFRRDALSSLDVALTSAGQRHEKQLISKLRALVPSAEFYQVPFAHRDRYELTQDAIRREIPFIAGAAFKDGDWGGYADLLIHPSVDPWRKRGLRDNDAGYAVCEIKLAASQNADYVLQAAAYADMLDEMQRRFGMPLCDRAYVWLGKGEPQFVSSDVLSVLYRRTRNDFEGFLKNFIAETIPHPDKPLSKLGPWSGVAEKILKDGDCLELVANIRRSQIKQIKEELGIGTMQELAEINREKIRKLVRKRILPAAHVAVHRQANLQVQSKQSGKVAYELLQDNDMSLPLKSEGDAFFDIEGFPLVDGGLEYLFGVWHGDRFHYWWAHTREEEEQSFILLMRFFQEQLRDGFVFHYGHYEVAALQRIATRVSTEDGVRAAQFFDDLIEQQRFFDVYAFVKSALVVGDSSYSIKKIEKLVGISREEDELADAQSSVGMYYEWREACLNENEKYIENSEAHHILQTILEYNRQDCESLTQVVDWLREKFPCRPPIELSDVSDDDASQSEDSDSPPCMLAPGACGRTQEAKLHDSNAIIRSNDLSAKLRGSSVKSLRPLATVNLSYLLQFYVKESGPVRHSFRERLNTAASNRYHELFGDQRCLTDVRLLRITDDGHSEKPKPLFVYSFNANEPSGIKDGDSIAFVVPTQGQQRVIEPGAMPPNLVACFMKAVDVDRHTDSSTGVITLSLSGSGEASTPPHGVLVSTEDLKICDAPLRQSILRKAEKIIKEPRGAETLVGAFLNRLQPIVENQENLMKSLQGSKHRRETITKFLSSRKRPTVFVIQGPPGSGKTYLSSRIIADLVMKHGKTVAVSSNSHAAIDKLLHGAIRAGVESGTVVKLGKRPNAEYNINTKANALNLNIAPRLIEVYEANQRNSPSQKPQGQSRKNIPRALVGGTCYQLSQEVCDKKFDILFIDEASQVTVSNFLAMADSAHCAVLVGDQQQLEMPIQGAHPGETGLSCLSYAVGDGVEVVSKFRGVFLDQSFRMNPEICSFISKAFYNCALSSAEHCFKNELHLEKGEHNIVSTGSGVLFIPCDHFPLNKGLSEESQVFGKWHKPAEVAVIRKVIDELLGCEYTLGKYPQKQKLSENDILVVAPYNMQVRALQEALPDGIRVGTVDKFQGQEAPVVLVSTCASESLEDSDDEEYGLSKDANLETWRSTAVSDHRNLRFSLKRNRINVAISRAQCLAVVTGQETACSRMPYNSLEDVELAALFERLQTFR